MKILIQSSGQQVYVYVSEDGVKYEHTATSFTFRRERYLSKNGAKKFATAKDFTVGRAYKKAGLVGLMNKYFPEHDGAELYNYAGGTLIGKIGDKVEETKTKRNGCGDAKEEKFKVDSILVCSWGYGQTNVDFYKVKRRTKKSVWLVEIGSKSVEGSGGMMCDKVVPDPDNEVGEVMMKRIYVQNGEEKGVSMNSYSSAHLWEGSECYRSWYN